MRAYRRTIAIVGCGLTCLSFPGCATIRPTPKTVVSSQTRNAPDEQPTPIVQPISGWRATSSKTSSSEPARLDSPSAAATDSNQSPTVSRRPRADGEDIRLIKQGISDNSSPPLPHGNAPLPSSSAYEIDLPSVMAMSNANHPLVAFMQWRVQEAEAQTLRAEMLWLPSLRAGINFNKHEGRIQDVAGNVIKTSRGSLYAGAGAQAVGAGSPAVPGIFASFHLTDALHQPEIAEQERCARQLAATAAEHDAWLQAALAYTELTRAYQERAIAGDVVAQLEELERITGDYARTGQGLKSDHERAQAELAIRRNDVLRAGEGVQVATARLAQQVRLDPTIELLPRETVMQPLSLSASSVPPQQLVADALANRPEAAESRHLVSQAVTRLQRETSAPWLPSVLLGMSYGGLTGGLGGDFRNSGGRFDGDVAAYWEVRQLGFGEKAARDEATARIEQAKWREISMLDRIAREVVEATAQVESRRQQIAQAETAVAAGQRSYEQNRERIRNAQGLPIETLQAIQALGQARREYLRFVADFNTAQLTQQRALGWPTGKPQ